MLLSRSLTLWALSFSSFLASRSAFVSFLASGEAGSISPRPANPVNEDRCLLVLRLGADRSGASCDDCSGSCGYRKEDARYGGGEVGEVLGGFGGAEAFDLDWLLPMLGGVCGLCRTIAKGEMAR